MESGKQNREWPQWICQSKVFKSPDQAADVLRGLSEQRYQDQFCDVVLVVQDQRVPAHRALLATCSQYFQAMFTLGMKEERQQVVELVGMSYLGLKAVVDFLYSGELPLDGGNIDNVLEAAHHLQVWRAVDFCCEYMEKDLNEDNFLYLQELALLYSLERLDAFIDRFILEHFSTLSSTIEFLDNVSVHKLSSYLCSDQVQHQGEQMLLKVALQWLNQTPERSVHARLLLSHIHFPLMEPVELVDLVLPALRSLPLTEESDCQDLVEEALEYRSRPSAQPLLQTERSRLRGGEEQLLLFGGEVSEAASEELTAHVGRLDAETGSWVAETELPVRHSHHCVAVLGGFVFVAGGSLSRDNSEDSISNLLYRYDPRHKHWTKCCPMNQKRVDFYLGSVGQRLIAVGGRNDSPLSSVEVYCPADDSWSYVAPLPRFTYSHAGTVHDGLVYVSGGHDYQIGPYCKDLLSYDVSKDGESWVERQPMSVPRGWHCMASLHHLIYAIGGSNDHEDTAERYDILQVESYDPRHDQWTQVSSRLPLPNSEAAVAVWAGKIYVLGGYSWEEMVFYRSTQIYDPHRGSWSRGPDLPRNTGGAAACVCTARTSTSPHKKKGQRNTEQSDPT
ncbi:kelch-like protein 36 isoform X2 [Cynoglossus semilaevis]|uniref:Kelch-like protein 36 n=1 Tax=Cynoglossus semilaevis TaxID=244447 RepID=A0A3P8UJJ3_CYNSE|nr:kelch-like protein 36 isoform X2 [Cynoglossus semilaevis]